MKKIDTLVNDNMSPEQVLRSSIDEGLNDVIVVGYNSEGEIFVRSSKMSRQEALWIVEQLRIYVLDGNNK